MQENAIKLSKSKGTRRNASGFSLIELLISMTITLIIVGLAFTLLARALNERTRDTTQAGELADANQAIGRMTDEMMNSGFALNSNGLVAADCTSNKVRIRANLNAFSMETTSGTVTDPNEDVIFQAVANADGTASLIRTDVAAAQSSVVATQIDNVDLDADGVGDGVKFTYLDASGVATTAALAVRVSMVVRITLSEVGKPGSPGYQPAVTKLLTSSVVLRNATLATY